MPKRSYDTLTDAAGNKMPLAKFPKTERSHEENQERAYIAASRRADRSLEARVQSAMMASNIHKKRTGRGLKVSEEIVLKEEMYEEMEDDLPRAYRGLTAHLQTDSPEFNHRVEAYIASQAAMATIAKYNEISKQFSEAFPRVASFSHQNSLYMAPLMKNNPTSPSPLVPAMQSQASDKERLRPAPSPGPSPSSESVLTPGLSPGTTVMDPMDAVVTPYQMSHPVFPDLPLDPQLAQLPTSSFTSELPNEIKMMANIDMNDPMAMHFYGDATFSRYPTLHDYNGESSLQDLDSSNLEGYDCLKPSSDYHKTGLPVPEVAIEGQETCQSDNFGSFDMRGSTANDSWESFVDFDKDWQ